MEHPVQAFASTASYADSVLSLMNTTNGAARYPSSQGFPLAKPLLLALVVCLPFMDLEVFQIMGKSVVLPYVAVAALAGALLIEQRALKTFLHEDAALPFLAAWLFFAGMSGAFAFLRSQDLGILRSNMTQSATLVYMGVHYVAIAAALKYLSSQDLLRVRDVFLMTAAAGGALSLYQVAHVAFGWPYVDWFRTSNLYHKANTLNWHGGGSWIAMPRAFGTAPEPTFWAGYLSVALGFALARVADRTSIRNVIEALLILSGLLLTFSRAAIPPLAAMAGVWLLMRRRMPQWLVPAAITALFLVTVWPAFVDEGWLTILEDRSASERLSAQVTGVRMINDYPLVGVGPGSVPMLIEEYAYAINGRQNVSLSNVYSFLLAVIVTTGVAGTILFGMYLAELGRLLWVTREAFGAHEMRALNVSALLAFACVTVYWMGSPAYNMSFLWFALAFGSALTTRRDPDGAECPASAST
jgi:hypothetical protein